jgi:hypothetical protein
VRRRPPKREAPPFPLATKDLKDSVLGERLVGDLESSWEAYHGLSRMSLALGVEGTKARLQHLAARVEDWRKNTESYITSSIKHLPADAGWDAPAFRLHRLASTVPVVTTRDLLRLAVGAVRLSSLNPFLTKTAHEVLRKAILIWLQLCRLEDRTRQLCALLDEAPVLEPRVVEKLLGSCQWDVGEHVEWLVFEVEGGLQVRPLQYVLARRLIHSPGAIAQLNMGEGKTRVILPLLFLHFSSPGQASRSLVRLHLLTQLLGEGVAHLQRHLTASVLNRRVAILPFNRDNALGGHVRLLRQQLEFYRDEGVCVCVAPEHRLSLHLKAHELRMQRDPLCRELDALEVGLGLVNILDESDEVLRHKRQLIYAVGSKQSLPGGPSRWSALQALLRIIDRALRLPPQVRLVPRAVGWLPPWRWGNHARDPPSQDGDATLELRAVKAVLEDRQVAVLHEDGNPAPEAFGQVRLLTGPVLAAKQATLVRALAEALLANPPHEFEWLAGDRAAHIRPQALALLTDPNAYHEEPLIATLGAGSKEMDDLLALRGLLACGLLVHCLQRRRRVDFGICRKSGHKRMAVPFRAADSPAERAEFGHPDSALVYTTLAYYGDGLSPMEVAQAFAALLSLGPTAQEKVYSEWFLLSKMAMSDDEAAGVDDINKIDLSNEVQRDLLARVYGRNFETINFWLANVVFPSETQQFPHRLVATAWDLCGNPEGRCPIGFSGTDDNKQLLPLQASAALSSFARCERQQGLRPVVR